MFISCPRCILVLPAIHQVHATSMQDCLRGFVAERAFKVASIRSNVASTEHATVVPNSKPQSCGGNREIVELSPTITYQSTNLATIESHLPRGPLHLPRQDTSLPLQFARLTLSSGNYLPQLYPWRLSI